MPKVSVIITCWNLGAYIEEALNSVYHQTFQDFEVIVVDDGSTDKNTLQVLSTLTHPKLSVYKNTNSGVAFARNYGIAKATGQYIFILDADDKISPTYIGLAADVLDSCSKVGIVYCLAQFFGDKSGDWDLPEYRLENFLTGNMIFSCAMFRRVDWEKVGGYKTMKHQGWEDYEFYMSLIEIGAEVYRIPERLFFYRQRAASMIKQLTLGPTLDCWDFICARHENLYRNNLLAVLQQFMHQKQSMGHAFSEMHTEHSELHARYSELHARYSELDKSLSWRITRPLRKICSIILRCRRMLIDRRSPGQIEHTKELPRQ